MTVFPIRTGPNAQANFSQAWSAGHQGTDIFAPFGAEVLAVADGIIKHAVEPKGGKAVYLVASDKTQYYYGHLDRFEAPRLGPGETRRVKAGDVIGYVGTSGNAKGKTPHVHFEMRPRGGAKADPYPFLVSASAVRARGSKPNEGSGWPVPSKAPVLRFDGGWKTVAVVAAVFAFSRKGRR